MKGKFKPPELKERPKNPVIGDTYYGWYDHSFTLFIFTGEEWLPVSPSCPCCLRPYDE